MCVPEDIELLIETTRFITNKARDQDIAEFFGCLSTNLKARRLLTKYLEDNYDLVRIYAYFISISMSSFMKLYKRLEANFQLGSLVKVSLH